jgi:hypothetical protein
MWIKKNMSTFAFQISKVLTFPSTLAPIKISSFASQLFAASKLLFLHKNTLFCYSPVPHLNDFGSFKMAK